MKVNIVIMGQSGNGKSTIVNAIMGKYVAPTGKGVAVTTKNQVYTTTYKIEGTVCELNLYDTVGIELSEEVTKTTLLDIENYLKESQKSASSDINLVWFCINHRCSRFQDFEIDLIRKLSYDYEIPFVIVMTQCFEDQIGELERQIRIDLPEVATTRILAEDYPLRGGSIIPAYGLDELLRLSIKEYDTLKVRVLESKLNDIQGSLDISEWYIEQHEKEASACIEKNAESAEKIGWVPGGCIPVVHGLCIKMVAELHRIYGIPSNKDFAESIFSNIVIGIITTPLMIIPILSSAAAYSYIATVGEEYAAALLGVMKKSKYGDLQNQKLMTERIRQQLNERKER